jgi:solute carrier family 25 protein 38
VYPDGLISPHWIAKHQYYAPSVLISFFSFTSDPARNSLNDNQLKNEINSIKSALYRSEYKTRYAVVLLSDKTILESADVEDRLGNIRRATGLDPRNSLFFLPPNSTSAEISGFVVGILSALQPLCVEYYRDLSKHARRKKGRGNVPPPTVAPTKGTSQTLSNLGWGVRYDFKQGVFAEFRREMDSASRHYQAALDGLFGPDGVFETTVSWSSRWNEARLLSDTVALRVIRCSLWNNLTSTATQSWITYRHRMQDLIDRRGKGSSNYGWEAWESRWAKMMAQLIQRADLAVFSLSPTSTSGSNFPFAVYAPPEKSIPIGERIAPSQLLHHPGYWLRIAAKHAVARRNLAHEILDEYRTPPGQSPASATTTRNSTYDTYLCPEPHLEFPLPDTTQKKVDHTADINDLLHQASSSFYDRNQKRQADRLQLEVGRELIRAGKFEEASDILKPLWKTMTWRKEKWWQLAGQISRLLHNCAGRLADLETLIATEFELCSDVLPSHSTEKYDLMSCGKGIEMNEEDNQVSVRLFSDNVISPFAATAIFLKAEGHAGEGIPFQLTLIPKAQENSSPITFSKVTARFRSRKHQLEIEHSSDSADLKTKLGATTIRNLPLQEIQNQDTGSTHFIGRTNLTLHPGQTIVLESSLICREAGEASIEDIVFEVETSIFHLEYTARLGDMDEPPIWWLQIGGKLKPKIVPRQIPSSIKILPRPPKMDISIPNAVKQFYADEHIILNIEIANHEDEDTEATLEIRLMSRDVEVPSYTWLYPSQSLSKDLDLPGYPIGRLSPGTTRTQAISFTAPSLSGEIVVEVKVLYHLLSDRNIPVSKTLSADISIIRALEANQDLQPRIHPDPWPSFFSVGTFQVDDMEELTQKATGITQKWELVIRLGSFADEDLLIEDIIPVMDAVTSARATFLDLQQNVSVGNVILAPRGLIERSFILDITKATLEERRPSTLSLSVRVQWKRANALDDFQATTTTLQCSDILVPNSEPRVLLTACPASNPSTPGLIHLDYTLENPTFHFLTFDLTMEASEDFAFSGPKFGAVNLLPLSRTNVRFNILPLVRGSWISPGLKVLDRWFGKQLRIQPGEGVRTDKKEIAIWIDEEEDD